jgi:predicted phage terminase large subunit-like protein
MNANSASITITRKSCTSPRGSRVWSALYLGDPVAAGAGTFEDAWLQYQFSEIPRFCYAAPPQPYDHSLEAVLRQQDPVAARRAVLRIQALDCAAGTTKGSDRTAIATVASDMVNYYIEDVHLGRWAFPDLKREAIAQYQEHAPRAVVVERASNGVALIDDLRRTTPLPIIEVKPTDSKEARAAACAPLFEAGKVLFPRHAPWLDDVLGEFLRFPFGRHDDAVDAIVWALLKLQEMIGRIRGRERFDRMAQSITTADWFAR